MCVSYSFWEDLVEDIYSVDHPQVASYSHPFRGGEQFQERKGMGVQMMAVTVGELATKNYS